MSIRFSCRCGRKLKVSDEKIGTKVLCSSCGATLKVPKKSQDEYWQDVPTKEEATTDYLGTAKEILTTALPAVLVIGALAYGAYFLANQIVQGRSGLPDLGKVTGVVTYNGKPVAHAMIRFIPLDEEGKERKGQKMTTATTACSTSRTLPGRWSASTKLPSKRWIPRAGRFFPSSTTAIRR
jgi:hypothetical protein